MIISVKETAASFLDEAAVQMNKRVAVRDTTEGERTAAQIAKVFNAITGKDLTEADAWTFLVVLKMVRGRNGSYNRDDYVDGAAYMALLGECEAATRNSTNKTLAPKAVENSLVSAALHPSGTRISSDVPA